MLVAYIQSLQVIHRMGDHVVVQPTVTGGMGLLLTDFGLLGDDTKTKHEVFVHTAVSQSGMQHFAVESGRALELLRRLIAGVRGMGPTLSTRLLNTKGVGEVIRCVNNELPRELSQGVAGLSVARAGEAIKVLTGWVEPDSQAPTPRVDRGAVHGVILTVYSGVRKSLLDKVMQKQPETVADALELYIEGLREQ